MPLTWYNVTKGESVRFRVIGSGSLYPLRVSVDSHPITIIASDGYDVAHTTVESFIINPGERFDFLLTANQNVQNYWIRANSIEVSQNFFQCLAIRCRTRPKIKEACKSILD